MLFLCGCGNEKGNMETALQLRNQLLQCERCTFQADITADYGEQLHRFVADCHADSDGNIYFTVMEPETIAGITREIHASGGRLTFDDTALGFPLLADGMLSPVSAPWVVLKALRSGYMASCGATETGLRLTLHDSYDADALQVDVWTDTEAIPLFAEILWQGRRILSLKIDNFLIL